nr:unnamed protein product [Callosobruchus analis]
MHCYAAFRSKTSLDGHYGKSIVSKKQDKVIYEAVGSKSFSCHICNYTAFSKHYLIDHMNVHDYVHDHTKSNHNKSSRNHKPRTCIYCQTIFKSKISLDDHVIKKHPDFITQITSKMYQCTKCIYKTTNKNNFERHMSQHPEAASSFKLSSVSTVTQHSKVKLQ